MVYRHDGHPDPRRSNAPTAQNGLHAQQSQNASREYTQQKHEHQLEDGREVLR